MKKVLSFLGQIIQKYSLKRLISGPQRVVFLIVIFLLFFYFFFIGAPLGFPTGSLVSIEEGMTLTEVSALLKESKVIRSRVAFEGFVRILADDEQVIAGDYFFREKWTAYSIARRVTKGIYELDPVKITLPEGATIVEMAVLFERQFPEFDKNVFLLVAKGDEGYLFPDTYRFLPNVKAPQVYQDMKRNFERRITEIQNEIDKSEYTLHEILTMASLLEEEARRTETRQTIAGILWKRLEIGMPLQVDATFLYINGKNTFELTLEDLRENKSPYNTYKFSGLPPGPITNPGMDSILAALRPIETPYLFYLADLEGTTHYSVSFEEHKRKKVLYLR